MHSNQSHMQQLQATKIKTVKIHEQQFRKRLFIYLFILHSMHAAIKAMAVNRHIVKDVNIKPMR